jgi:D-arabinose 1-dehydrogenase-like Zn-dependent alcohol dehydrogenase
LANYDWGSVPGLYAVVGHEITGVVSKIGDNVKANLNQSLNFVLSNNFKKKQ